MDEPEFDPFQKMDCKECNETLQKVLSSPRVQLLVNALKKGSADGHTGVAAAAAAPGARQTAPAAAPPARPSPALGLAIGGPLARARQALGGSANATAGNGSGGSSEALLATSPAAATVAFGGEVITASCRICKETGVEGGARAFLETPPTALVLCANRLRGAREVEEALVHELVHAYDFCIKGRDLFDCKQLAYSEVRAAREAECYYRNVLGSYGPTWFKEKMTENCIEKNAVNATKSIFPDQASSCVAAVFHEAIRDLEPFGKTKTITEAPSSTNASTSSKSLSLGGAKPVASSSSRSSRSHQGWKTR